MTALLLIPLMIFSAFAVDIGAWYLKGQQVQRATDAAALAGVVYMPNLATAEQIAIDVAAKNGMIDQRWVDAGNPGVANATVVVSAKSDQLRVRIDTETPAYLGKIVLDEVNVERYSVADITSNVGFGSPNSGLGTGNLGPGELGSPDGSGSYANGFWLGIKAHCASRPHGDPFSALWDTSGNSGAGCSNASRTLNPTFAPEQEKFVYVVDIPEGITETTNIEVLEPGTCTSASAKAREENNSSPLLQFRVYASDNTHDFDGDNLASTPVFDQVFPADACSGNNGWYTLASVPPTQSGKWYVEVNSRINYDVNETGHNNFALRAVPDGGSGHLCARSATNPTCPSIYAREWLGFYRSPNFGVGGDPAEFFLSQISEEHAGKTLQIRIFDSGEGMDNIQFINDHDQSVDFTYRRTNCSVGNDCSKPEDTVDQPSSTCEGNPCLDVTNSRYNNQFLTVEYDIPSDYTPVIRAAGGE